MSRPQSHNVPQTLVLHLGPGVLPALVFGLAGPPLIRAGYPAILGLDIAILVAMIPVELGYLLYAAKRSTGSFSLRSVVDYREPLPTRRLLVWLPLLLAWSAAAFALMAPLDAPVIKACFAWMPEWWTSAFSPLSAAEYSCSALVITFAVGLVTNGIAGPLVEELYFRGHLLPRIPLPETWAPLLSVTLFSLYHFFSPWQLLTRIVAGLPMTYAVMRKRSLLLSVLTHIILNSVGWIGMFALLLWGS